MRLPPPLCQIYTNLHKILHKNLQEGARGGQLFLGVALKKYLASGVVGLRPPSIRGPDGGLGKNLQNFHSEGGGGATPCLPLCGKPWGKMTLTKHHLQHNSIITILTKNFPGLHLIMSFFLILWDAIISNQF